MGAAATPVTRLESALAHANAPLFDGFRTYAPTFGRTSATQATG